ncbi:MAG: Crp/Fnr family transcriptional regulator [Clostridiales bacterium]|nr:Crp/Fnr family transcriptional regulator [Clostridiales bacterium]
MKQDELNQILQIRLLQSVPQEKMTSLLECGQWTIQRYNKSKIIHLQNDTCTKIEVILTGKVLIDNLDAQGNLIAITQSTVGDILGGNLLFSSSSMYPMTITAQATTTLLSIQKSVLLSMFQDNTPFLANFLQQISDNTQILSTKIINHIHKTIRKKIITYLTSQQQLQKKNPITLPITKKKMAESMSIARTSLSRELMKMHKEKMITVNRNEVTLINLNK